MPTDKELSDFAKVIMKLPPVHNDTHDWIDNPILNIEGVRSMESVFNYDKGTMELTIYGGDKNTIAQVICETKPLMISLLGSTVVNLSTFHGDYEIRFNHAE